MKNLLLFEYKIDIDNIMKEKIGFSFLIDYNKYLLKEINRPLKEIELLYDLISNYFNKYYLIIKNIHGEIITKSNDNKVYILIKENYPENEELDLYTIYKNKIEINDEKYKILFRNNWNLLWSSKVDYLEYQVSELGKNHPIILDSFSYYVGLAENAIAYFNMLNIVNEKLFIQHRLLEVPSLSKDYLDPLNLIIDYNIRDIAEYIKLAFFSQLINQDNIIKYVNSLDLTSNQSNLLFVRLIYPSYYFHALESVFDSKNDEEQLLNYINRTKEFETLLKNIYMCLNKKNQLIKVDWLIKEVN